MDKTTKAGSAADKAAWAETWEAKERADKDGDQTRMANLIEGRDNWKETARFHLKNEVFYRNRCEELSTENDQLRDTFTVVEDERNELRTLVTNLLNDLYDGSGEDSPEYQRGLARAQKVTVGKEHDAPSTLTPHDEEMAKVNAHIKSLKQAIDEAQGKVDLYRDILVEMEKERVEAFREIRKSTDEVDDLVNGIATMGAIIADYRHRFQNLI